MRMRTVFFLCLLTLPALVLAQDSAITMTYQGTLHDAGGEAVNEERAITFNLYEAAVGGEPVWSESHPSVDVVNGQFAVSIGSRTAIDGAVAGLPELYLGITIGDEDETSPRMRVGGAVRAHHAEVADHARDVRDEDIHPASVSIGNLPVIDGNGQWVGDPVGLRGPAGPAGDPGAPGAPGANGADGRPGRDGADGRPGRDGRDGVDGNAGRDGVDGAPGADGADFDVNLDTDSDGYTDWLEVMVGSEPSDGADQPADADEDGVPDVLVGPQGVAGNDGAPGNDGNDGNDGARGTDGTNGADGASVEAASINEAGELLLELTNGSTVNAGNARGATGDAGNDGVGVANTEINDDGDLIVTLTNGLTVNAGQARGADGRDGIDAENQSPLTNLFTESPRSVNTPTDIPRASNQGADSILDIDYNGVITAITVNVDITHPDTTQLELLLIAPDGQPYTLHDSREGSDGGANLSTTYPEPTAAITALDALIGSAAAGRWILRAIDRDLGNENADRIINSWGLNITRRADNAWRLPTNLVVDGAVDAQTLCRIQPLVQNGNPVPGAITLTCGNQDPVRLTTFQCGNGVIDPAETCDDGNFDAGDGCDARCLTECGNGRLDDNEECEDGNVVDTDACTSACNNARCGDGFVWFGTEDCDQGDEGNSDEPNAVCRTDCTAQRCGDGIVDAGEECDDGNDDDLDECSTACIPAVCGDGLIQVGEECDDQNLVDDDECSNACLSTGLLRIRIEGHEDVFINCDVGDYTCQAERVCEAVTNTNCIQQEYSCSGPGPTFYPAGTPGGSAFNFNGNYDFVGDNYGNICACSEQYMRQYGLAINYPSCGVGHWFRR